MAQPQKKPRPVNQSSVLLSNEENKKLFSLVGPRCVTLSSAVVQLVVAKPPLFNCWHKELCGVATFIKDNNKRSYFIRIYSLQTAKCIWEQEIYNQFKYYTPVEIFHTFDTDECPVGLNFANENEANKFKFAVQDKLEQRRQKRNEKRLATKQREGAPVARPEDPRTNWMTMGSSTDIDKKDKKLKKDKKDEKKSKKKDKKNRLRKVDIGEPTDFRHVGHAALDASHETIDINQLQPEVLKLLNDAGVTMDQLRNKETSAFIYSFLRDSGQMSDKDLAGTTSIAPSVPSSQRGPPPLPPPHAKPVEPERTESNGKRSPPPPVPPKPRESRGNEQWSASTPGKRTPPPPPPVPRKQREPPPQQPQQQQQQQQQQRSIAPPISQPPLPPPHVASAGSRTNAHVETPPRRGGRTKAAAPRPVTPPPPPPPPPNTANKGPPIAPPLAPPPAAPPLAPPMPPPQFEESDGRGDLLKQIRGGTSLKPVEANDNAPSSEDMGGGKSDMLLQQIRQGIHLKSVDPASLESAPKSSPDGLAGALSKALALRARALQDEDDSDDDEDSSEEYSEDEWDD